MAQAEEALSSVAERARRALRDNEAAPPQPPAHVDSPRPVRSPAAGSPTELIAQRMQAIARVKELEPRLASARARAGELSQRLTSTPPDSVHYAELLRWLADVHVQLRQLEAEYEEAQHIIRNSAWVMQLLADPLSS
ncbi:hypothetical protein [Symbiobacterium thermophilum]|nr:hypothetical protein [Symbiobacterium thermophilum]MBY6277067.1 hypothetical protein [Symbiobacterium thermophilum]